MSENIIYRSKQNNAIDLFKLIASYLIVSIHTLPFSSYSDNLNSYFENIFCRLAVCFFFFVSAYFFFNGIQFEEGKIKKSKENFNKLQKYFIRIFLLYFSWSLIYLIWSIPKWYQTGWLSFHDFIDFGMGFVFTSSYYHLWFLLSLLYSIPIMYFLLRHIKVKYFIIISILIYVIGVLYSAYSWLDLPFSDVMQLFSEKWPRMRTSLFCVIPMCSLSLLAKKITATHKTKILLLIIFLLLHSDEGLLLFIFTPNKDNFAWLIFTLPVILFLFLFLDSTNISLKNGYFIRKLSTIIYCMHPLIMGIFQLFVNKKSISSLLYYIIICILTTVIGICMILLYKKFKCFKWLKYLM